MSRSRLATQIPGDDETEIPGASQPGDPDDPTEIADARERQVQAMAMAEAAASGKVADIAPSSVERKTIKPGKRRARMPNGDIVEVDIAAARKDINVELYGPEVNAPKGSPVRKDGTPCQGSEQPYGYVGDIMTKEGRLVSRVIPYESLTVEDD